MHPKTSASHLTKIQQLLKLAFALALCGALAACATTPTDLSVLDNARLAIQRAETAGANDHAPLELRLANRRLTLAEEVLNEGNRIGARHLADQAEIEAQLALARTRAALARLRLQDKQLGFETLKTELVELYGEEVLR